MNIFGFIFGPSILALIFGVFVIAAGSGLLYWGLGGKLLGILVFAGGVGGVTSLMMREDATVAMRVFVPTLATLLAACFATISAYSRAETKRPSFTSTPRFSRNQLVLGLLAVVIIMTTFSFLRSNVDDTGDFFNVNDPASERAYERSSTDFKRSVNNLLAAVNAWLAQ